jgi:ribosomal subunit interface protein
MIVKYAKPTSKNSPLSKDFRQIFEKKLKKLDKFFKTESYVEVTHKVSKSHKLNISIENGRYKFRAMEKSNDMYKNIEPCIEKLARMINEEVKKDYRSTNVRRYQTAKRQDEEIQKQFVVEEEDFEEFVEEEFIEEDFVVEEDNSLHTPEERQEHYTEYEENVA